MVKAELASLPCINTVFGEKISATGVGLPITDKISLKTTNKLPVNIYDTVGLELGSDKFDLHSLTKSNVQNDIKKQITKLQKTKPVTDDINIAWFAISGNSARVESTEIDLINWIIKHNIPVIVVLTKSFDHIEANKLKKKLLQLLPDVDDVVITLADKSENLAAFGVDELIEKTFDSLPESLKNSFVHSQSASLGLKKSEAIKVVNLNMATNFGVGFSPLPGSDSAVMLTSESAMITKITSIYGVDIKKKQLETFVSGLIGMYSAVIVGKSVTGSIAKILPGLGTVGGGLISGGVGMVITGALGRAYIELMEQVSLGKIDLSSSTP